MRFAAINNRKIAQRARRDAEAGDRCRSYGVRIDSKMLPKVMGLYRAAAEVSSRIARVPGKRSGFWQD